MFNGVFLRNNIALPVSQIFKFALTVLMVLRLIPIKEFGFLMLLFVVFQVAPLLGYLKTQDISALYKDIVVATKWFNVPLSFFYFKIVLQSPRLNELKRFIKRFLKISFGFLSLNMLIGVLGFGVAFYYEGYPHAVGTRGLIYAGNELAILNVSMAFIAASYYKEKQMYLHYGVFFILFMVFAFLMTSKTVMAGTVVVFILPWISTIKKSFSKKWVQRLFYFSLIGLPVLITGLVYGVTQSGFLRKLQHSNKVNEGDFWTIFFSNRNVFLKKAWGIYSEQYSAVEKIFGLGQHYFINLVEDSPEMDLITLFFTNGVLPLLVILVLIAYWFINAYYLGKQKENVFAKQVFVYLVFILILANTAGHILNSGISAYYIGLSLAIMFYRRNITFKPAL